MKTYAHINKFKLQTYMPINKKYVNLDILNYQSSIGKINLSSLRYSNYSLKLGGGW